MKMLDVNSKWKTNILLLVILMVGVLLVYHMVERRDVQSYQQHQKLYRLFGDQQEWTLDSLKEFGWGGEGEGGTVRIIHQQGKYYLHPSGNGEHLQINQQWINEFFKKLSHLQIIRVFTSEEEKQLQFSIPELFSITANDKTPRFYMKFNQEEVAVYLGSRTLYDDSFYLRVVRKKLQQIQQQQQQQTNSERFIAIARDTSVLSGLYLNQQQMRNDKYLWWQRFFSQSFEQLPLLRKRQTQSLP